MKKKLLGLTMAVMMAASLVACGSSKAANLLPAMQGHRKKQQHLPRRLRLPQQKQKPTAKKRQQEK